MEELSCVSSTKATEVAYKDNNTPVIIIAYENGATLFEYNPTENKWIKSDKNFRLDWNESRDFVPFIDVDIYSSGKTVIVTKRKRHERNFKYLVIDLEKGNVSESEYKEDYGNNHFDSVCFMCDDDFFITQNHDFVRLKKEDGYRNKSCIRNRRFGNNIRHVFYVPDKDLPYIMFTSMRSDTEDIVCVLTDFRTVLSGFSIPGNIFNISYNDGIIIITTSENRGTAYQVNPLSKTINKIESIEHLAATLYFNNQLFFVTGSELIIASYIGLEQVSSFHSFPTDSIIRKIYSENDHTIIVENNEENQKIYSNNKIIGFCNKNSKLILPNNNNNNIKYYDNINNIIIEIIEEGNERIEKEKEKKQEDNNNNNNTLLINNKNRIKICEDGNNIVFCEIINNYLYCLSSDFTLSKWIYDNSNETFNLNSTKKLCEDSKVTYANGNRNYFCIYSKKNKKLFVQNINVFESVGYSAIVKSVSVLYMDDYDQIYTGNCIGMVKKFKIKPKIQF